jgi:mRNA interferase MazF
MSVPAGDDDRALVTVVPHTTSVRHSAFKIVVPVSFLRPGAFDAQNLITIPHARLIRSLGRLSPQQLTQVEDGVRRWLSL